YRHRTACPRCGVAINAMLQPKFLHYTYYHCTKKKNPNCTEKTLSATALEEQIAAFLQRIQISKRFQNWAIKYLRELHGHEIVARNNVIESQQKAYRDCLTRLDNLVKLKTSSENTDNSLLSDEEYGQQRSALLKEKVRLEELFQDTGQRIENSLKLSEHTFNFACNVRQRFAKGDFYVKKEILSAIGSNL